GGGGAGAGGGRGGRGGGGAAPPLGLSCATEVGRSKETVMKSKAAIQVEPGGPLVIEEIDIPDPGPNQVTVRNFASGVCYSQVHQLRDTGLPRPMGLGHEGSGVVTQVGKEVTHVKEGDHVITTWVPRIPISGLPVSRPTGATFRGRARRR